MNTFIRYSFYFLLIFTSILLLKTIFTLSQTLTPDFLVYYTASHNMFVGNSVYMGHSAFTLFAYPLVSTVPFLLFTFFPYHNAQVIFLFLNILSLIGISVISATFLEKKLSFVIIGSIFAFSFLSFPTKFTFGMGQVNLIAYFFLLFSLFFFLRKRLFFTALLFTLACMCKPILGFTILFFLFNKQWKVVLYSFALFILWFFLPFFWDKHALQDYNYYLQAIVPEVSKPIGREIYYNQGFSAFIFRLTTNQTARIILSYISMIGILSTGIWHLMKKKKNYLYQWSLLLTMIPLLDPMSWQHHFVILTLPFSFTLWYLWRAKKYTWVGITAISYILVSINFKTPFGLTNFPTNILFSHTFLGAFILFCVLCFMKPFEKKMGKQKA